MQTINMANYRDWFISAAQDKDLRFDTSELSTHQSYVNGAPLLEDTVSMRLTGRLIDCMTWTLCWH